MPSNTPGPSVRTRGLTHSVSGGELLFLVYFVLSQIIHWLQLQTEKTKKSEEKTESYIMNCCTPTELSLKKKIRLLNLFSHLGEGKT